MLKWRKLNWNKKVNWKNSNLSVIPGMDNNNNSINDKHRFDPRFVNGYEKVESLVLNPMPKELYPIFYDKYIPNQTSASKAIISFESVIKRFPNLTDLFLRETTFMN